MLFSAPRDLLRSKAKKIEETRTQVPSISIGHTRNPNLDGQTCHQKEGGCKSK